MSRLESLKRALRRIESTDPTAIREQSVQALLDHSAADFGFLAKYVVREGELVHGTFTVCGDREASRSLSELEGTPSVSATCWNPWRPRPVERQRFVSVRHGPVPFEHLSRSEGYRLVYEPFGIRDHARILLYDGTRFLGWLGIMRGKHDSFDRRELAALNGMVREVSAALSAAENIESEVDGESLFLIVDPRTLKVECASQSARVWLNRRRGERLETLLRAFRRGEPLSVAPIDGYEVRVVELAGDGGTRYHIHVALADVPRVGPRGLLSPRQLEVAEYAAAGATRLEIAQAMNLSGHTVADHLKAIYERLGIGSRAELATLLAEFPR